MGETEKQDAGRGDNMKGRWGDNTMGDKMKGEEMKGDNIKVVFLL